MNDKPNTVFANSINSGKLILVLFDTKTEGLIMQHAIECASWFCHKLQCCFDSKVYNAPYSKTDGIFDSKG